MIPGKAGHPQNGVAGSRDGVKRPFLRRSLALRNIIIQKRVPGAVFAAGLFLYTALSKSQAPLRVFF
ncbi:hypothetical protein CSC3H3_02035 [Thalassospira marina]|uniref:Uncharacterized protein n=1 Tax=Thalassospira marina TaxID=2048283 RepID=A0ABM6Q542_9PROT|nr:hypothetical protein CSC3H3_02035 [Thalassospira marina]